MSTDRVTGELTGQKQSMLTIPAHVRIARDADGAMVLDLFEGQVYQVNLVGSRILEMLKEGADETRIASHIAREFEIEQAIAEADLREFLESIEKHRLTSRNTRSLA